MHVKQKERIIKWNKDRDNINLDFDLELKMLSEERREFWLADSLAHKMQEFCDFQFVKVGTDFKIQCHLHESVNVLLSQDAQMMALDDVQDDYMMYDHLMRLLKYEYSDKYDLDKMISDCLDIVITANEAKPKKKDSSGKIIKGEKHTDPLKEIEEYLCKFQS